MVTVCLPVSTQSKAVSTHQNKSLLDAGGEALWKRGLPGGSFLRSGIDQLRDSCSQLECLAESGEVMAGTSMSVLPRSWGWPGAVIAALHGQLRLNDPVQDMAEAVSPPVLEDETTQANVLRITIFLLETQTRRGELTRRGPPAQDSLGATTPRSHV